MAVYHASYTVGTTPTLIVDIPAKNPLTQVTVYNDNTHPIFLGDSTVATSGADKGIPLAKSTVASNAWLNAGDKIYAVAAAETSAYAVTVFWSSPF
jgi:hypothetical protein